MKKFIVDACIAVKWFIPERHSQAALKLLGYDFVLMAPDYLLAEVSNVL
jgi:predicted nucleic acid-binding protein